MDPPGGLGEKKKYIYIYMYVYGEREREIETYIYIYIRIYIYIYVHRNDCLGLRQPPIPRLRAQLRHAEVRDALWHPPRSYPDPQKDP